MEKRTKHHNVPESLGGSRNKANLSDTGEDEHAAFHSVMGHLSPDMILRRMLLSGIRTNGKSRSIPFSVASEILQDISKADWKSLYVPGTFDASLSRERNVIAHYHSSRYLTEEMALVENAIGRLAGFNESNGMKGPLEFFRTKRPVVAIHRMLHEQDRESSPKWTKPLNSGVRTRILDMTNDVPMEHLRLDSRRKMINLLEDHANRLVKMRKKPDGIRSAYTEVLAKFGEVGFDIREFD